MLKKENKSISRRNFVKLTGAVIAASSIKLPAKSKISSKQEQQDLPKIAHHKILGRTGFKVSDIGMGTTRQKESNVFRYAYDRGVNYFDTAEGYTDGLSERLIGEALQYMDRKKIFITTKLKLDKNETKENIIKRVRKCLERLKTDYVDALYTHMPPTIFYVTQPSFHEALKELKAEGRVKYTGISSHGPRSQEDDSMEKILCMAAEDGRFDLMLWVYNFLQK